MNLFLTTTNIDQAFSEAMGQALGGLMTLIVILWIFGILVLVAVVALITWVVKKVWHAGENREYKRQQKEWARAQRQWSKKQNRTEWDNFRKYGTPSNADFRPTSKPNSGMSPTGWFWDEEKGLWIPPNQLSEESKRRWSWDGEKRIWKDNDRR